MRARDFFSRAALPIMLGMMAILACIVLQEKGLALMVVFCLGALGCAFAWKRVDVILPLAFAAILLMPFFLGISRTPKIFLDELLLLALLPIITLQVMGGITPLRVREKDIALMLFGLCCMALTMSYNIPAYVSLRTFLESMGLGVLLCLAMAQVSSEEHMRRIVLCLCLAVVMLAAGGILEVLVRANPLMEYVKRSGVTEAEQMFFYISPEMTQAAGVAYRPYLIFFHPSEAGTTVALCLPFILALASFARYRRMALAAFTAGALLVIINQTRGVWVACLLTAFFFLPRFRRLCLLCSPLLLGVFCTLLLFADHVPFLERVMDARNLFIRFFYWETGLNYYFDHWLLGIGFGQFSEVYQANPPRFPLEYMEDALHVFTMDNAFLMVLVEQGIIGFLGFMLVLGLMARGLRQSARSLEAAQSSYALFARAGLASLCIFCICGMFADVHLFTKSAKIVFMLAGIAWGLGLTAERGEHAH